MPDATANVSVVLLSQSPTVQTSDPDGEPSTNSCMDEVAPAQAHSAWAVMFPAAIRKEAVPVSVGPDDEIEDMQFIVELVSIHVGPITCINRLAAGPAWQLVAISNRIISSVLIITSDSRHTGMLTYQTQRRLSGRCSLPSCRGLLWER